MEEGEREGERLFSFFAPIRDARFPFYFFFLHTCVSLFSPRPLLPFSCRKMGNSQCVEVDAPKLDWKGLSKLDVRSVAPFVRFPFVHVQQTSTHLLPPPFFHYHLLRSMPPNDVYHIKIDVPFASSLPAADRKKDLVVRIQVTGGMFETVLAAKDSILPSSKRRIFEQPFLCSCTSSDCDCNYPSCLGADGTSCPVCVNLDDVFHRNMHKNGVGRLAITVGENGAGGIGKGNTLVEAADVKVKRSNVHTCPCTYHVRVTNQSRCSLRSCARFC